MILIILYWNLLIFMNFIIIICNYIIFKIAIIVNLDFHYFHNYYRVLFWYFDDFEMFGWNSKIFMILSFLHWNFIP